MDEIVGSHSKDLEGLSQHLGRLAELFDDMRKRFLSKELEYLMNVHRELEKENKNLKESVKEWKALYYEAKGTTSKPTSNELEIGYTKLKEELHCQCIDEIGLSMLGSVESTNPRTTPQCVLHSKPKQMANNHSNDAGSHAKPTASGSKLESGKAKGLITPPNSTRKITTAAAKERKSLGRYPKPLPVKHTCGWKRVLSSDGDGDSSPITSSRRRRPGPGVNSARPMLIDENKKCESLECREYRSFHLDRGDDTYL